jgi:chaperonin GroEL
VANAGGEGSVIVAKVAEGQGDFGYNAKTDEYVNMLEAGIIDPTKVTRVALKMLLLFRNAFNNRMCYHRS